MEVRYDHIPQHLHMKRIHNDVKLFHHRSCVCLFSDIVYFQSESACFLTVVGVNIRICFKTRLKKFLIHAPRYHFDFSLDCSYNLQMKNLPRTLCFLYVKNKSTCKYCLCTTGKYLYVITYDAKSFHDIYSVCKYVR
jgi:hypothetical protein